MINPALEIKERLTMSDICSKYGIEHKRRTRCPLHGGDGLNFEIKRDGYVCYSQCGSGDIISFVQKLFGLTFPETLRKIDADFLLGLYEKPSLQKYRDMERVAKVRESQRAEKERRREKIESEYWEAIDEWIRLDKNLRAYKPKTAEEPLHELFVEAIKKIHFQEYLVSCAELRRWRFATENC